MVGSNSNSNSNSNGHGNSNSNGHGNGSRASGVGKSEQSRGPILNDYRGDRDRDRDKDKDRHHDDYVSHGKEQQQSKPLPKAAFGGSILSAPRNMFSKVTKESTGPGSVATKSTASSMKKIIGLAFGGRASSVSKERKGKIEQEGVGVGSRDKKGITALKGPITSQYDSDDDAYVSSRGGSRRGSDPRRYIARTGGDSHDSMGSIGHELNGQSEYLRMDKQSQDVMSEDQLERLLVQAKSVRSTTSRQTTR